MDTLNNLKSLSTPNLQELQNHFIDYIYKNDNGIIKDLVTPEENLDIYKNSIFITQTEALNTIFNTASEYLTQNPHNLDLKYNLQNIIKVFVKNIPCGNSDYLEYAEKFIIFLKEITLTPNIEYLNCLMKLDINYSQLLMQKNNILPDYSILQNIDNCNPKQIYITTPDIYKIIELDYDIIDLWDYFITYKEFKPHKIIKTKQLLFMTCFNHNIYTILINHQILTFLNLINKSKNSSIESISSKYIKNSDFENIFISCVQKNLIYIENDA